MRRRPIQPVKVALGPLSAGLLQILEQPEVCAGGRVAPSDVSPVGGLS